MKNKKPGKYKIDGRKKKVINKRVEWSLKTAYVRTLLDKNKKIKFNANIIICPTTLLCAIVDTYSAIVPYCLVAASSFIIFFYWTFIEQLNVVLLIKN